MTDSKYEWIYSKDEDNTRVQELATELDLSPIVIRILLQKGIDSVEAINDFLSPNGSHIHDPFELHDMDKAIDRIQNALMNDEKIVIYGDYDADGITSTAVMYETLEQIGANVTYFVPDRFKDGYGPNLDEYKKLVADGMQLLITVDNGITGVDEIQYLKDQGIDTIVTDHHEIPANLPSAYAIVHPSYPNSNYPFKKLAGVGVAFKVACALLEEIPEDLLDLVAIGTMADLVDLSDENRDLVTIGLKVMQNTDRLGLFALYQVANIDVEQLNADTIGFMLAPRLNSLGRMKSASLGVELLTTTDEERAKELAEYTQKLNQQRQKLVAEITDNAVQIVQNDSEHLVNIVAGKNWYEGVLGIVASRLVEQTGKPTLVLTQSEDHLYKGSGRSPENFNLFEAFDNHRKLFKAFGGHAQACGLTIKEDNLSSLQVIADQEARNQKFDPTQKKQLKIAEKIDSHDLSLELVDEIEKLAPFGMGNKRPLFEVENIEQPIFKKMGAQGQHYRIDFMVEKEKVSAVKFNDELEDLDALQNLSDLKIAGDLTINEWQGKKSVQLKIQDLKFSQNEIESEFKLKRIQKLQRKMFNEDVLYGFFDEQLRKQVISNLNHPIKSVLLPSQNQIMANKMVIVDYPATLDLLKQCLNRLQVNEVLWCCYVRNDISNKKLPQRQDFGKLYRFILAHQVLNVHTDLVKIAEHLNFDQEQLLFMLRVFSEVGFVKIKRGLLEGVKATKRVDLTQTLMYQKRIQLQEIQRKFLNAESEEFSFWLKNLN